MTKNVLKKESNADQAKAYSIPDLKYIIVFICSILLLISMFSIINFFLYKKTTMKHEKIFQEQQALQVMLAKKALEAHFNRFLQEIKILGIYSIPEFVQGTRTMASLRELFSTAQQTYPENLAHVYMDAPGHVIHAESKNTPDGAKARKLAQEWATAKWSEISTLGHKPFIPPFHVTEDTQMCGILLPVLVENSLQGVLIIVVDLKPMIMRYVAPIRSGEYGAAYLLDERGRVLYDHETEIIGRNVFNGIHSGSPDLMEIDKRQQNEPTGMDEYTFTLKRGERTSRKLIAWNTANISNHKLLICLSAPDIEINKTLYGLRLQRIISGVFLAVLMILMTAFFYRVRQKLLKKNNKLLKVRIRQQTQELRRSEERLELALKGGNLGLWDWDIHKNALIFNDRWAEMLGYNLDEIEQDKKTWENLLHPDDISQVTEKLNAHLKGDIPFYETEFRMHTKMGDWVWILARGRVMDRDKEGQPLRATGTHLDITKRKQAEHDREELIKKLQQALDKVNVLSGLIPICSNCKKIRDDKGYWNNLEAYIETHSDVLFSHGLCFECSDKLYGKEGWYIRGKEKKIKEKS